MKIPFTLRLAYHGVRVALRVAVLFFCAWLVFIPANAEERAALGASADQQYPLGLRPMRTARAIVLVAPDRFYGFAADMFGPEVSPLMLRIAMLRLAAGIPPPGNMQAGSEQSNGRDIDGPKFIQVD